MKNFVILFFVLILITGFGVTAKLYFDSQNQLKSLKTQLSEGTTPRLEDDKETVEKVGKHIVLPYETPRVVTLSNIEQLKSEQLFFAKASEGDKLLIYPSKVILYSPELDRVVEVAQIKPEENSSSVSATFNF